MQTLIISNNCKVNLENGKLNSMKDRNFGEKEWQTK
jgi:hypothetical protein